jgi:dihydroorotase
MSYDLFLKNGEVYINNKLEKVNLGIKNQKVSYIGPEIFPADEVLDLTNKWVLPGLIDSQVHFREPGLTHKEDLSTGTLSAVLGGITAVLEMPNTKPSTSTKEAFQEKLDLAKDRCYVDYGFFMGATHENVSELKNLEKIPGCCGIKIFMGSSTGSLLLDDDQDLEQVFASTSGPISVHCEDEKRLLERKAIAEKSKNVGSHCDWRDEDSGFIATEKVVRLSKKYNRPVHVLHISSKKEIEFLEKEKNNQITVECLPQHLTLFAPECYEELGTRAQMNPPIREKKHYEALLKALKKGVIDVIGSDHAPHTLEEKSKEYPQTPSGMPGVQTMVTLMLDKLNQGALSLQQLVSLLCYKPVEIFKIMDRGPICLDGYANFTVVDVNQKVKLQDKDMATKSKWTPYHGKTFTGGIFSTILRGRVVMLNGKLVGAPQGLALEYLRNK